jgi:hypothetical protein
MVGTNKVYTMENTRSRNKMGHVYDGVLGTAKEKRIKWMEDDIKRLKDEYTSQKAKHAAWTIPRRHQKRKSKLPSGQSHGKTSRK